jgi:PAS domain S-box-containing protein
MPDKKLRLLLAEDSEDDAELLQMHLRRDGYELETIRVDTPEAMVEALGGREWDLIISDYQMPNFTGAGALELYNESGLDIPFILVSGRIGDELAVQMLKAGAHDYIPKDNMARLGASIQREMRGARLRRERREAREALEASERKYSILVERSNDGIVIQQNDVFMFVNRRVAELFGRDVDEITGRSIFDFIAPESQDRVSEMIRRRTMGEPVPGTYEIYMLAKGGARIPVEVSATDTEFEGQPATIAFLRDTSVRKKAEELERKAARDEIFGFIASALPAFANSVPLQVRQTLTASFADNFERNMKARFEEHMTGTGGGCGCDTPEAAAMPEVFRAYLSWVKQIYTNLGVQVDVIPQDRTALMIVRSCPWPEESRGNPIFCLLCRAMVHRSLTWTDKGAKMDQEASIAAGAPACRFVFVINDDSREAAAVAGTAE